MGVDAMQEQNDAKVEAIKNPPPPGGGLNAQGGAGGNKQGNSGAHGAGAGAPKKATKPAGAVLAKALGSKKKNLYHSIVPRSQRPPTLPEGK